MSRLADQPDPGVEPKPSRLLLYMESRGVQPTMNSVMRLFVRNRLMGAAQSLNVASVCDEHVGFDTATTNQQRQRHVDIVAVSVHRDEICITLSPASAASHFWLATTTTSHAA